MASTYTKLKLSSSTDGKQIKVGATGTPGTLLHTAVTGSTDYDEVWIYATNNHTASLNLTIEWGGTTSPDDLIQLAVPAKTGLYLIIPGLVLQNGNAIRAFAGSANLICISGWVNKITNT